MSHLDLVFSSERMARHVLGVIVVTYRYSYYQSISFTVSAWSGQHRHYHDRIMAAGLVSFPTGYRKRPFAGKAIINTSFCTAQAPSGNRLSTECTILAAKNSFCQDDGAELYDYCGLALDTILSKGRSWRSAERNPSQISFPLLL